MDFWGKFRRGIESADAAYLASIASYDYVLATLLGDFATTYIGIRTLQTQIAIARENIVKQKKALAIAQAKYHGGTATKLDVYQAENVLAATEATIPQLTIQLKQGLNALRVLLGMAPEPLDNLLGRSIRIPVPPRDVAVGIPADLVRRRPDIRAAELAAAAQSAPAISAHPDDLVRLRTGGRSAGAGDRSRGERPHILGAQRPQRHHRLNLPRGAVRPLFLRGLAGLRGAAQGAQENAHSGRPPRGVANIGGTRAGRSRCFGTLSRIARGSGDRRASDAWVRAGWRSACFCRRESGEVMEAARRSLRRIAQRGPHDRRRAGSYLGDDVITLHTNCQYSNYTSRSSNTL